VTALLLDTARRVETPEGIALLLQPAGLLPRSLAYIVDFVLRAVLLFVLAMALQPLGGLGQGLVMLLVFALEWFYPVVFEVLGGATPGKRLMGLRVVMDDGLPVTWPASLLRNLLRVVDFLPTLYLTGCVSCLLRADFKRLGDVLAGTLVVHRSRPPRFAGWEDVAPLPPPQPLTADQQAAVLSLAARAPRLTPERLDELAGIAATVLPASAEPAGRRLLALAAHLRAPQR